MNFKENPITKNRAEEQGFDLWEDYVIPPYYNSLELGSSRKPRVIIGGRGCGKTSLLRFLCHATQFSLKRTNIQISNLEHIGIYWKVDTQFAKILSKRGISDVEWLSAFEHMATISMVIEVLKSIENIVGSSYEGLSQADIENLDFSILESFNNGIPKGFYDLKKYFRMEFNKFQTWVGNIRSVEQPVFIPKHLLNELITELKEQLTPLNSTNYYVYIDEYENLLVDQQKLINTWLKHSEMPLIYNIAMKRHSFKNRMTVGNEQLSDIHDYRTNDLESYFDTNASFSLFAAEILFLRLKKLDNFQNNPISVIELKSTDPESLTTRQSANYKAKVINAARNFLPGLSVNEMAVSIFKEKNLKARLLKLIQEGIEEKGRKLSAESLIDENLPEASIILPALLNRNLDSDEIVKEITNLRSGLNNKFNGKTGWIHNNLVGCILLIYEPLGRSCPFYAGFDSFTIMSKTNIRHFLELCNKSMNNAHLAGTERGMTSISIKSQAEAAKHSSTSFLKEVKSFGVNGNALHRMVIRLGTYFGAAHTRPSQSEPEQNHFSVKGSIRNETINFIEDAVKWSVFYEYQVTKEKGGVQNPESEHFEYVLNPIYAPYFHISYRKKRRIIFTPEEIDKIVFGDFNDFKKILKSLTNSWTTRSKEGEFDLFNEPKQK